MQYDLLKQRLDRGDACSLSNTIAMATEYMPVLKWLNLNDAEAASPWTTVHGNGSGVDESDFMNIDEDESMESIDEIEDW